MCIHNNQVKKINFKLFLFMKKNIKCDLYLLRVLIQYSVLKNIWKKIPKYIFIEDSISEDARKK